MITMNVLSNSINSKSALESMGFVYTECNVSFNQIVNDKTIEDIEKTVEKYSLIKP